MTEIFLYIVNMSITASILAVVVLLLRLVLKKAPKWISVLLWGLVALRLICPFAVESPFSLMPKTDWVVQETLSEEDLFLDSVPDSIPVVDSSSLGKDVAVEYSYYPIENPEIEIHRGVSVSFLLSCVWIAGMAALLLHTVISTVRLRRSIGAAIRVRENIWESSAVDSPFVLGLIRPRIYVPRGMSEEKLAYVVAHEQAHIRRKDHWWKPLGFLLLTVHWFNPVMWLAYILLCRDIEMACDEKVIRDMGEMERADYSEALLECSVKRSMISACPLAFGEVGVKERIKTVLNYKKPAFWIVLLAVIACVAAAVCFLTNPMNKPVISIDEHDWYFERAYIKKLEKDITIEVYQPGLQPKTENAEPVNSILIPGDEPMWYDLITGDWDTNRFGNHFIFEKADSKSVHYTVELYRDTGELYTGVTSTAVIEPMKNGDGYILTIYENSIGAEKEIIFTTQKQPGAVNGEKKLT
ncbi:MAG: M56 family metallopeptidase, partial [Clostridia bacterium]|nr:M56 family metallopeptidase [Clostridia bacterium]